MPEGLTGAIFGGAVFLEVTPELSKFASEAKAEVAKAATGIEGEAAKAFAGVGKAATFALVGAAVAIGAASLKAADAFEASHARLETALHNAGDSFEAEAKHITATDKAMERFGFTNADVEGSLASLVTVTKSSTEARKDESLAADIARGRHIDLATATGILVKVESGHVALLGRLGINTKDVNGNLITQQEALKRLSDLYGGNASAYADTFAGKMQVLRATSEDLAKNIGLRLIPILETLASDGLHVVQWLEDHRAAAVVLGTVIGGPLVAAMGAYVALQAKALAENVAGFFSGIADAAALAIGPLLGLDSAVAGIGFTELGVAAPGAATGFGTIAAAAGTAAAALGPAVLLLAAFGGVTKNDDEATTKWANNVVKAGIKAGDATKAYRDERAKLTKEIAATPGGDSASAKQLAAFHKEQSELGALEGSWKKYQAAVKKSSHDAAEDHAAASAAIVEGAAAAGQAATNEGKKMAKAVADLTASVGPDLARMDVDYGLSATQIQNLAKEANATTNAIASSFDSATSVVQAFAGKTDISFKDVNKFFKDQITEARNWANNLKTLAADGIDGGLLKQLAEAGPKSAPLVTALLNDIKAGNLAAINQDQVDLATILGNTVNLINSYDNPFYASGQAAGAALASGFNGALTHIKVPTAINNQGKPVVGIAGVNIPGAAKGRFIDHPQLLMVGEESRREVVLPLEDKARSFELLAQSGLFDDASAASTRSVGAPTAAAAGPTFIAQGVVGNKAAVTRWMREAFSDHFGGSSPHNRPVWASGTADR